ncbi:MAG TPA: NAD/NADP octopine/nopaline dehydrogenase family protein [Thermomicrobiales bacterium]|jgi:opine dehydrogenase
MTRITVLGGGNTAFSLAANLALAGHEVLLWEHPGFAQTIAPIQETRTIHLEGTARTGAAHLAGVTVDPAEALAWSETLVCSVPAYAHRPFVEQLAPHLRPGHVLALLPGNLGTLAFARALREAGASGVMLAEADTAPYVCRKLGPDRAVIWGTVGALGVGVYPASQTAEAMPVLERLFPGATAYANVLEAGLSAMNPVVHPPGVLLNAGRIERSRGEFWFYEEGVTPAVVRAIEALDGERRAVGRAYGYELTPVAEAFHKAGFGPAGDLWSVINGSAMLTALRAPGSVGTRWLTEDVPYGLVTWAGLGAAVGVATPVMEALITLASAVLGVDCRATGRSADALNLTGGSPAKVRELLEHGGAP